jgi:hypothetical protein
MTEFFFTTSRWRSKEFSVARTTRITRAKATTFDLRAQALYFVDSDIFCWRIGVPKFEPSQVFEARTALD